MLVLTRKVQQEIVIGNDITITVLEVSGSSVRLGIDAPKNVRILRRELQSRLESPTDETRDSETDSNAKKSLAIVRQARVEMDSPIVPALRAYRHMSADRRDRSFSATVINDPRPAIALQRP